MKKLLSVLLTIILIVSIIPLGTFALNVSANSNYYSYRVSGGKATITDVDTSISGDITVPSEWGGFTVTAIGDYAFYECDNITSVTLPDSITSVGEVAFGFCDSLERVSFSENVTIINDGAFSDCVSLKTVSLGNKVTAIGDYAFANCASLTNITVPDSVTSVGEAAFSHCKSLTGVSLSDNVTSIGKYAFGWCDNLISVTIGDGVTEVSEGAFGYCENLASVSLGDNVASIGSFAFCNSAITDIVIPNGVTAIGNSAFESCDKLSRITMPSAVKNIDSYAFYGCDSIADVWYMGSESNEINIGLYNECLTAAIWHYSICKIDEHIYPDSCLNGCTVCGWVPDGHSYTNACDKYCNMCNNIRAVSSHSHKECFIGYEQNEELYGSWQKTVSTTGVYKVGSNSSFEGKFNVHDIAVFDKQDKEVLYYEKIGGWPLVKDQEYTVKFRYDCSDKISSEVVWSMESVADTIFADTLTAENGGWYNDAVTYNVGAGIITGYGGTDNFGTADKIQRQDFVVILARLAGVDLSVYDDVEISFNDVADDQYYTNAILWAADKGITTGYSDGPNAGKFGVGDVITREQLVTFLYRYAKVLNDGAKPDVSEDAVANAAAYADYTAVTGYAQEAVIWALDNGVIKGQGGTHIDPAGNALRCEVAQMIYNIFLNDIFN